MKKILALGFVSVAFSYSACAFSDLQTAPRNDEYTFSRLKTRYFAGLSLGVRFLNYDLRYGDTTSEGEVFSTPRYFSKNQKSSASIQSLEGGVFVGDYVRLSFAYQYERDPLESADLDLDIHSYGITEELLKFGPYQSTLRARYLQSQRALASLDFFISPPSAALRPFFGLVAGYEDAKYRGSYAFSSYERGKGGNSDPAELYNYRYRLASSDKGLVYGAELGALMAVNDSITVDISYRYLKHSITHTLALGGDDTNSSAGAATFVPTMARYVKLEPKDSSAFNLSLHYLF